MTALAFVFLLLLHETESREEARAAAGQRVDRGNSHFEDREFEAALDEYDAAYDLYPSPKIFFNMAECYRELGRLPKAAQYYKRFLEESGTPSKSPLAERAQTGLRAVSAELATLIIESDMTGPVVHLDRVAIGTLPLEPVLIMPGTHVLSSEMPGHQQSETRFEANKGETSTIRVELRPMPIEAPSKIASASTPELVETVRLPPAMRDSDSVFSSPWFWIIAGAVVASGVGVTLVVAGDRSDFEPQGELGISSIFDAPWEKQ